jgi:hypothetical protein
MSFAQAIRQIHRWASLAFPAGVLLYLAAMARGRPAPWLGVFPLLPLVVLLLTGLPLYALPYLARARRRRPPT